MKYFIDTEFHEGFHKPFLGRNRHFIDLISIGIVAEDGREYYAISKDFDIKAAWNAHEVIPFLTSKNHSTNNRREYWLRDNVLKPIFEEWRNDMNGGIVRMGLPVPLNEDKFNYRNFKKMVSYIGKPNKQIAEEIKNFINAENFKDGGQMVLGHFFPNKRPEPEFYAYFADYDWVVFCTLFGKMIDLPEDFPMYCCDLKQMLDEKAKIAIEEIKNNKSYLLVGDTRFDGIQPTMEGALQWIKLQGGYPKQTNEHNALADAKWNKELYQFLQPI